MEIVREYTNGELTVIWKPGLCIHAGVCVRMLPQVYRPRLRPWVDPTRATTRQLIEQIECCPSGAFLTPDLFSASSCFAKTAKQLSICGIVSGSVTTGKFRVGRRLSSDLAIFAR